MTAQRLNRVHVDNLCHLIQLREAIHHDLAEACLTYGIDRITAESYGNASDEDLRELAFSVDQSFFTPRFQGETLRVLLRSPIEFRGTLAVVHCSGTRLRPESMRNRHSME